MKIKPIFTATLAALSIQGSAQLKNAPAQIIKTEEEPSLNGIGFQPGGEGISLEEGQALRFYANQPASIETIPDSSAESSDDERCKTIDKTPSLNGVGFHPGGKGISLEEGQAFRFSLNKPPELS